MSFVAYVSKGKEMCVKKLPPEVLFPQRLRILNHFTNHFTRLLYVRIYATLRSFIQLSLSLTLTQLCYIKRERSVNFAFH